MNKELIVTHPGGAHFDEVTAISLILAMRSDSEFVVERRDPTISELDDPRIWVIDIGRRLEPENRNFDHHQSLEIPASFVLVAEYLGLSSVLRVMPWWDFKDAVDRFGPVRSSEKFGAGDHLVNRNPAEEWLVSSFASNTEGSLKTLKYYGHFIIDGARRLETQVAFWRNSPRITVRGMKVVVGETRDSFGLEDFKRLDPNPPDIVISLDSQRDGWRLFRFDGAPVDFSTLEDDPRIEFAHKSGFLAKTKGRIPLDEVIALLERAILR